MHGWLYMYEHACVPVLLQEGKLDDAKKMLKILKDLGRAKDKYFMQQVRSVPSSKCILRWKMQNKVAAWLVAVACNSLSTCCGWLSIHSHAEEVGSSLP